MHIRRFTLPTLGATGALAVVALTAGSASAHVSVSPDTTAAGSYAVLTFSVPHGCEGSPTTKVAIQLPEDIPQVTPTVNPNWTVEKVNQLLAQPVQDAHGNEITERVSQVVYTAKAPLEDGFRDTLALSLQLPDKAGETLTFPVLQTCAEGETGWTETPAEGQDAEELELPAPSLMLTDAAADESDGAAAEAPAKDDDGNGLAVAGLVAGLAGLVLGGVALVRSGRSA